MKHKTLALWSVAGLLAVATVGCARPGEIGYTQAYTTKERTQLIARNWDVEGKQSQDDLDSLLMLRPMSDLSIWHAR